VGPHITYADRVEKLQTDFPSGQAGQSRVAPMAGVYGEYLVVPFVAGRVELNYVQKGFSIPFNLNGTAGNVDLMLHYVELPIFLKAQYRIGRVTPFVLAGGSAAYLVSAEGAGYYGSKEISAKISDGYFKSYDLSAQAGAGLEFDITSTTVFSLQGRYTHGLVNVINAGSNGVNADGLFQNRGITAVSGLGYRF
jgi:opacity protein-like surface antigen